jgi:2-polyprenyl-3-methyl-5-hydroxy-6-metoxy-1,4-benzoquinol methylase
MFFIQDGYVSNLNPSHHIDLNFTDESQKEVYIFGAEFMKKNNLKTVVDVGCGSGYKLVKYFSEFETVGIDTEPCYSYLLKKYPTKKWLKSGEPEKSFQQYELNADMVICSDVIEHIINPTDLLNYIKTLNSSYILLSTPDRRVLRTMRGYGEKAWNGPPVNPAHVREWTPEEFHSYISEHFTVLDSYHCKNQKECMYFLCKPQ